MLLIRVEVCSYFQCYSDIHSTITHFFFLLAVMDEWVSNLTIFLSSVFSQEYVIKRVVVKDLGVCSAEDLKYLEADDLAGANRNNKSLPTLNVSKLIIHEQLIKFQFHMMYKVLSSMHDKFKRLTEYMNPCLLLMRGILYKVKILKV